MPRPKILNVGDIAEIRFLDHCEDPEDDAALEFVVWGRITAKTRTHYEVTCWAYADGERYADHNEKRFQILRKTILSTKRLKHHARS